MKQRLSMKDLKEEVKRMKKEYFDNEEVKNKNAEMKKQIRFQIEERKKIIDLSIKKELLRQKLDVMKMEHLQVFFTPKEAFDINGFEELSLEMCRNDIAESELKNIQYNIDRNSFEMMMNEKIDVMRKQDEIIDQRNKMIKEQFSKWRIKLNG